MNALLGILPIAGIVIYVYTLYRRFLLAQLTKVETQAQIQEEFKSYNNEIKSNLDKISNEREALRAAEAKLPDPNDPLITGKRDPRAPSNVTSINTRKGG